MDPIFLSALNNLAVNGITYLATRMGRKGLSLLEDKELLENIRLEETALEPILTKAIEHYSDTVEWQGPIGIEELCLFLASPEAELIVRQIFSAKILSENNANNLNIIKDEFKSSFSLYLSIPRADLDTTAEILFSSLIESCEKYLELAIDKGILSAHEAKSTLRHRIIHDELEAISKNIKYLSTSQSITHEAIIEFETNFRSQVGDRHRYITPPHFDVARKIPIDNLYVTPNFIGPPLKKDREPIRLSVAELLSVVHRTVMLGNPGGGKSTFTHKLCHDIATNYSKRIFGGRELTPILVILREYGAEKKQIKCSLLKNIETTANSRYQVSAPDGAFEYLLHNGRVLVIFDGLDELLDTSYRQEISGDVESFCKLYPSVPVLVTSREVGYEQAPLDKEIFNTFKISDFDEDQIKEYASKWFKLDTELSTDQQIQKVDSFISESSIVPDLRRNPLMLALMCNIYLGENYIPKNRPDVYEKCALMLFERWDISRGIQVALPFEAHIRPAMMYLANWIYSDESLQGGVTETNLVNAATDYLHSQRFEDRDEAEKASREFIAFCRGRAWVFTDTGTTKEGERLYQFTHRTFLEYFTASYIVRVNPTPDKLLNTLTPRIKKREWDVVAQLAFQKLNRNVEGAGDELLSGLLGQKDTKKDSILAFTARCLEFMVPSPKVLRNISTACITFCLSKARTSLSKTKSDGKRYEREIGQRQYIVVLAYLLNSAYENRTVVADCIKTQLLKVIQGADENKIKIALEIGMHLNMAGYNPYFPGRGFDQETEKYWSDLSDDIVEQSKEIIISLGKEEFQYCFPGFLFGIISAKQIIEWQGMGSIYKGWGSHVYGFGWASLAEQSLYCIFNLELFEENKKLFRRNIAVLDALGEIYSNVEISPLDNSIIHSSFHHILGPKKNSGEKIKDELIAEYDSNNYMLFGTFVIIAVLFEKSFKEKDFERNLDLLNGLADSIFEFIRWTVMVRINKVELESIGSVLTDLRFTQRQHDTIIKWALGKISFVTFHKRSKGKTQ